MCKLYNSINICRQIVQLCLNTSIYSKQIKRLYRVRKGTSMNCKNQMHFFFQRKLLVFNKFPNQNPTFGV